MTSEEAVISIAIITNCNLSKCHEICKEIASHYPVPSQQTLEDLYVELCEDEPTELTRAFDALCRKEVH